MGFSSVDFAKFDLWFNTLAVCQVNLQYRVQYLEDVMHKFKYVFFFVLEHLTCLFDFCCLMFVLNMLEKLL